MAKSILQDGKYCCLCYTTQNLHRHHLYPGGFRNKSEKYGLWVYLCFDHHVGNHGVHTTPEGQARWKKLKAIGQKRFEELYSHELFMKEFKRNYLEE